MHGIVWDAKETKCISGRENLQLSPLGSLAGLIIKMGEKKQEKIKFTFTCMEVS